MKARYDDKTVDLSEGFLCAIELLMNEMVEMMKAAEPEFADSWHWGRCTISDLSLSRFDGMTFEYGGMDGYAARWMW